MTRGQLVGLLVIILAVAALVGAGPFPWLVIAVLLLGIDKVL